LESEVNAQYSLVKLVIDIPDRWGILTAHRRRFGMKNPVFKKIQDRKVKEQAAHAAACATGERERASDLPFLRRLKNALLYLEKALREERFGWSSGFVTTTPPDPVSPSP
jgi:hypothetical protein